MRVVPQAFYRHAGIEKIMVDDLSCIVFKSVDQVDLQNQRYLASHALTLVLSGGLIIESFEGTIRKIGKGQMVFLPKGMYVITDIIPDKNPFEAVVFFFDEEVADDFLKEYTESHSNDSVKLLIFNYDQDLRLFTDTLLSLYRGKQAHQFTRSKLLELLHLIALSEQGSAFVNTLQYLRKRQKRSISEFMELHFDKPLDLEDYAYLTGRSVSTFQRDFKRRYGESPKKWLIQKRLKKAADLLRTSNKSVVLTMQEVGFENTSHFIKSFHKKFGISPKQYQIKHRNELRI